MWAKAALTLQLGILVKTRDLPQLARSCVLVIRLDNRNASFVANKLWAYLQANVAEADKFFEVVGNYKFLVEVVELLREWWAIESAQDELAELEVMRQYSS